MNKLKGIILVVSICFASIMMPFNIYADSATVVGTDVSLISTNTLNEGTYTDGGGNTVHYYYNQFVYKVNVELDNNYVGYLTLRLQGSYYTNPQSGLTTSSFDYRRKVFVNGSSVSFNFIIVSFYAYDPLIRNSSNGTPNAQIVEQGVTLLSELDSIQQIIDILNDLYNSNDQIEGLLDNQIQQLSDVVANTSLANDYLEFIQDHIPWNFPIESLSAIGRMLNNSYINDGTYELMDYHVINRWTFPLFAVRVADFDYNNATIYPKGTNAQDKIYFVVCTNSAHVSYWNRWFTITQGGTVTESQTITRFNMPNPDTGVSQAWGIFRYTIQFEGGTSAKSVHVRFINNPTFFIPIYWGYSQSTALAVSTDFALQFGLKNEFLENLDVLANGNTESNSASQQLDSDTSDFNTDRDDLIDIEDSMGNNMDSAMNQITPNNNGLSGFGGNFLTSAVWVRTQFERLTNNTPYGSLIVYGMTLGLALLLLGKVML